mmetsp:Transcript_16688/g.48330  ORF Transcript_16688/g.48330 Transcript_16688/m.48330 type:complete len:633 (-) Transcript_16688:13-1911(-)
MGREERREEGEDDVQQLTGGRALVARADTEDQSDAHLHASTVSHCEQLAGRREGRGWQRSESGAGRCSHRGDAPPNACEPVELTGQRFRRADKDADKTQSRGARENQGHRVRETARRGLCQVGEGQQSKARGSEEAGGAGGVELGQTSGEHHREGERELDRCERAQTRRKRARARREQRQRWRGWCRLECRRRGRARGRMQWRGGQAEQHSCRRRSRRLARVRRRRKPLDRPLDKPLGRCVASPRGVALGRRGRQERNRSGPRQSHPALERAADREGDPAAGGGQRGGLGQAGQRARKLVLEDHERRARAVGRLVHDAVRRQARGRGRLVPEAEPVAVGDLVGARADGHAHPRRRHKHAPLPAAPAEPLAKGGPRRLRRQRLAAQRAARDDVAPARLRVARALRGWSVGAGGLAGRGPRLFHQPWAPRRRRRPRARTLLRLLSCLGRDEALPSLPEGRARAQLEGASRRDRCGRQGGRYRGNQARSRRCRRRRARRAEKPRQHTLGICQRLLGCHHSGEPRHACDRFAAYCEQRSAVKFAARGVLAAELLESLLHIGQLFGSRDQLLQLPDPRRLPLQGGGQPLLFGTLVSSGGLPQRDEAARRGDHRLSTTRKGDNQVHVPRSARTSRSTG